MASLDNRSVDVGLVSQVDAVAGGAGDSPSHLFIGQAVGSLAEGSHSPRMAVLAEKVDGAHRGGKCGRVGGMASHTARTRLPFFGC